MRALQESCHWCAIKKSRFYQRGADKGHQRIAVAHRSRACATTRPLRSAPYLRRPSNVSCQDLRADACLPSPLPLSFNSHALCTTLYVHSRQFTRSVTPRVRSERETRAKAHLVLRVVAPEGVVLSTVLRSSFRGNRAQMGGRHSAYTLAAQFAPHTTPRRVASLEADEGLGRGQRLQVTAAVFSLDVAVATTTHLIAFADFTAAMGFCPGAALSAHIPSFIIDLELRSQVSASFTGQLRSLDLAEQS